MYSIPVAAIAQETHSGPNIVSVIQWLPIIHRLDNHGLLPPILFLHCPKHYLIGCLMALLVVSVRGCRSVLMAMMVFLLLLLWLLLLLIHISIPSTIECTTLPKLLHFLCILGHERIGFSRCRSSCVDGRRFIFIRDHETFLHRPSICLLLRLRDKWLSLELVA